MSDRQRKAHQDPKTREEAHPLAAKPREAMQGLVQTHQQGLMYPDLAGAPQGTYPEQIHARPAGDEQAWEDQAEPNEEVSGGAKIDALPIAEARFV